MKRLAESRPTTVTVDFEGDAIAAVEGEPLAAALLAAGERVFSRSVKYHRPRGPYCMTGACSHCLMRVDGTPNVFTCRTPVAAGMRVERQNAYPSAKVDVFRSIDWLFPRGLDHHAMFAGVPVAETVMAKVARHLAGLGMLPDQVPAPRPPAEAVKTRVAIVGAGPAGLAVAQGLAAAGVPFVLIERDGFLGGRLATGPEAPGQPAIPALSALPAGAVRLSSTAVGWFDEAGGAFLATVSAAGQTRLGLIFAERFVFAVGGHAPLLPFGNNDLPGVFSGRAACTLVRRDRVLPGETLCVVGSGEELEPTAALLKAAGARIALVLDLKSGAELISAHGRNGVQGLTYRDAASKRHKVPCDALVLVTPLAPSFELAQQAGAVAAFDPTTQTFTVAADASGRTAAPATFAAGDILGARSAAACADAGVRTARALIDELAR